MLKGLERAADVHWMRRTAEELGSFGYGAERLQETRKVRPTSRLIRPALKQNNLTKHIH